MREVLEASFFALYLSLSMLGIGNFLIRKFIFKDGQVRAAIEFATAFTTGFSAYALFFFTYYFFLNTPGLLFISIVQTIGVLLGLKYYKTYFNAFRKLLLSFKLNERNTLWIILFVIPFILSMVLFTLMAICPAKLGDSINGYLETSRWIYHNGFNSFDPHNTKYSTMPVFTETVYSLSFVLKSEIAAKIFDAICGFTLIIAIYGLCATYVNRTLAFYSAISFIVVEDFSFIFGGGKIDIPSQLVLFLSFVLLLINISKPLNIRYIILSGILFSVSVGQKYTNGLFVPLYGGILFFLFINNKLRASQILRILGTLFIISVIIVFPHLIKNYVWCGNPFAPFDNPIFHSRFKIMPHEYSRSTAMTMEQILLFPKTMFLDIKRLPLTILVGLILYFFSWKKLKQWNPILIISFVQLIIWVIIFKEYWFNSRFMFGLIALFIFLASIAINQYYLKYKYVRMLIYAFGISIVIFFCYDLKRFTHNIEFMSGKINRMEWENKYNSRCAELISRISPGLNKDNKMFCLGGVIFKVPYEKLSYTNTESERIDFISQNQSKDYLLSHGFTYLLFRPSTGAIDLIKKSTNDDNDFTDEKQLPDWLRNTTPYLKSKDGLIFKIE